MIATNGASLRVEGGASAQLRAHCVARAGDKVVVDHAARLHERVADRRADEFETALQEILAQRVALRRACGKFFHRATAIHERAAADELPEVAVEAAEL